MNTSQDWKVTVAQVLILAGIATVAAIARIYFRSKNPPAK